MLYRIAAVLLALNACLTVATARAQVFDGAARDLLRDMRKQPTDLARYIYLVQALPNLTARDRQLATQFISFSQCELGIYTQAILSFPLSIDTPSGLDLPSPRQWRGVPAAEAITAMARERRIVMINEAHHDAHTRQLTLELLPRLRALGFNYFAAEALLPSDSRLSERGYPVRGSGTEYLREPLYGDIVRTALRLGYHVIAYDSDGSGQERERQQARNLYRQVFARDPSARLFVHAGYAHIDKAPGRLDGAKPMALLLQQLSGDEPLSIDQSGFLEVGWDQADAYHRLIEAFPTKQPEVLLNRVDGKPWSAQPAHYDVNVLLPLSLSMAAFGKRTRSGPEHATVAVGSPEPPAVLPPPMAALLPRALLSTTSFADPTRSQEGSGARAASGQMAPPQSTATPITATVMQRPSWLTLNGQRRAFPVSTALCHATTPCVVEALYANESDQAIAADRYAFMADHSSTTLYLRPGSYRVRASNSFGATLSTQMVTIPALHARALGAAPLATAGPHVADGG